MPAPFIERFRAEIDRYASGVHQLGSPTTRTHVTGLPAELATFLSQWNGAELFIDTYTIHAVLGLRRKGPHLFFGTTHCGSLLALDLSASVEHPPVVWVEPATSECWIEGTGFSAWLLGTMAAESVVFDHEGEFREGVFVASGVDFTVETMIQRETQRLRCDPHAPTPKWRLACALEKKQQPTPDARLVTAERVVLRSQMVPLFRG